MIGYRMAMAKANETVEELNNEMAHGIVLEIGDTLKQLKCCHDHEKVAESTPAMFYREWILCCLKAAVEKEREACVETCWDHQATDGCCGRDGALCSGEIAKEIRARSTK